MAIGSQVKQPIHITEEVVIRLFTNKIVQNEIQV